MPGGLLHIFELRAVFERRCDEGGAHRVRGVAEGEPERAGIFADSPAVRSWPHVRRSPARDCFRRRLSPQVVSLRGAGSGTL